MIGQYVIDNRSYLSPLLVSVGENIVKYLDATLMLVNQTERKDVKITIFQSNLIVLSHSHDRYQMMTETVDNIVSQAAVLRNHLGMPEKDVPMPETEASESKGTLRGHKGRMGGKEESSGSGMRVWRDEEHQGLEIITEDIQ